jgi:hypothetical protein
MTKQADRQDKFLHNNPDDINNLEEMKQQQKLANDFDTPYSEPEDTNEPISKQAQQADTGLDSHEIYDEGFSSATEKKVENSEGSNQNRTEDELYPEYDEIK